MTRALAVAVAIFASAPAWAVYQCGDTQDTCQCGANNPYPCCDNGGNCTWYAWHSACCNWGVGLPGWGNANTWASYARAHASYDVSSFPVSSSVSCKDTGTYGHVAWVTGVSGANISVREQNCWGNYGARSYSYAASYFTGGYIVRNNQVQCRPGDSQTQSCGNCGNQRRGCGQDGKWGAWGACGSEGVCRPDTEEEKSCGTCGAQKRRCTTSCEWGAFSACGGAAPAGDAGVCDTGNAGACGAGTLSCVAGNLQCAQSTQPAAETCDGVDNDCDGQVDEAGACPVDAGGGTSGTGGGGGSAGGSGGGVTGLRMTGGCSAGLDGPALALGLLVLVAGGRSRRTATGGRRRRGAGR